MLKSISFLWKGNAKSLALKRWNKNICNYLRTYKPRLIERLSYCLFKLQNATKEENELWKYSHAVQGLLHAYCAGGNEYSLLVS